MKKRRARRKKNKSLSIFAITIFASAVISLILATLPAFKITEVMVSGARLLSPDEAIRIANVPIGDNLFIVRLSPSKRRLLEIPIVREVSFSRILPSKILIKIEERQETVVCVLKDKQSLILDHDGVVMNPTGISFSGITLPDITDLPVMNGLDESWLEDGRHIKADVGRDVLNLLSQFEDFVMPKSLQIDVSNLDDITLLVDDILKVKIGAAFGLKEKMKVFEAIYSKVKDNKTNIEYIDVSSCEFPAVKFKS